MSKKEVKKWLIWNYTLVIVWKGVKKIVALIMSMVKLLDHSSLFSIFPATDYSKHVPQNAKQLMNENWQKTGKSLYSAMLRVSEEVKKELF